MSGKSLEKVSDSSSNKRMKEMSIDRLSDLPDPILIHILSFLGLQKSAVTSVLSKRWKFMWAELPRLEFKENSSEIDKKREFVAKVNRTLLVRSSRKLEKFDVYFRYDDSFASDVDSWIDFVVKNKAEEVCLILESGPKKEFYYDIPGIMFSNPSLTLFSVQGCSMDTLTKIEWGSLTQLDINDSKLPQHVIENILSGCPVLHTLVLEECLGFNCLDVKSRNLYKLTVHDLEYRVNANGPLLEISAPYVQTLDISFHPEARKLVLRNIKSLVSAEINFTSNWCSEEILISTTVELYEIFKDVKELKLGRYYFKALSELVVDGWQLPVSRRKSLTVFSFSEDEHNISGIFALLKFSPKLERFVIEGFDPEGETWDEDATGDLDCDLLDLKTVEIIDFADPAFDGEPMLTVVQTLLKRATVLEEMTIRLGVREINDYVKISQTLLTYPRSSGKAVVRLC